MGIDEIKLGAIGNLNDINFYIKVKSFFYYLSLKFYQMIGYVFF